MRINVDKQHGLMPANYSSLYRGKKDKSQTVTQYESFIITCYYKKDSIVFTWQKKFTRQGWMQNWRQESYYVYCCHSMLCVWLSWKVEGQKEMIFANALTLTTWFSFFLVITWSHSYYPSSIEQEKEIQDIFKLKWIRY